MQTITLPTLGDVPVQIPTSWAARMDLREAYGMAADARHVHRLARVYYAAVGMCWNHPDIRLPRYDASIDDVYSYSALIMERLVGEHKIPFGKTFFSAAEQLCREVFNGLPTEEGVVKKVNFTSGQNGAA